MKRTFILAFILCNSTFLHAEIIRLKDGSQIKGTVVNSVGQSIYLQTANGPLHVEKSNIDSILYSDAAHVSALRQHLPEVPATGDDKWTGNINLYGGEKVFNDVNFSEDGTDHMPEAGMTLDFRNQSWPINFLVGYFRSSKSNTISATIPPLGPGEIHGTDRTEEFRFGVRKIWDQGSNFQVFLGGGVGSFKLHSEASFSTPTYNSGEGSLDENNLGFWADLGVGLRLAEHLNLGMTASLSRAQAKVQDQSIEIGGNHLLAFLGYHW